MWRDLSKYKYMSVPIPIELRYKYQIYHCPHIFREKYNVWSSDKIWSIDLRDRPGTVETDNMAYQNRVVDRSPEASRRKAKHQVTVVMLETELQSWFKNHSYQKVHCQTRQQPQPVACDTPTNLYIHAHNLLNNNKQCFKWRGICNGQETTAIVPLLALKPVIWTPVCVITRTTCQQSNHEANKHHGTTRADCCESY